MTTYFYQKQNKIWIRFVKNKHVKKSDLKIATDIDTSMLTKEVNLASIKSDINDLDNNIKMMLSKELYMLNWLKSYFYSIYWY